MNRSPAASRSSAPAKRSASSSRAPVSFDDPPASPTDRNWTISMSRSGRPARQAMRQPVAGLLAGRRRDPVDDAAPAAGREHDGAGSDDDGSAAPDVEREQAGGTPPSSTSRSSAAGVVQHQRAVPDARRRAAGSGSRARSCGRGGPCGCGDWPGKGARCDRPSGPGRRHSRARPRARGSPSGASVASGPGELLVGQEGAAPDEVVEVEPRRRRPARAPR